MDLRKAKKKPEEKRVETIQVLLNEEEKLIIHQLAKDEGLPVSTWIRWKLLKKSS